MSGTRLIWIAARAAIAAGVALAVTAAVLRVFDFGQLSDFGEATLVPMVDRLAVEPRSPVWLDSIPYTLSPYAPGYYSVVLAVSRWLPWQHSLIPGRLVSLGATLATAALIALVVGRRSRSGAMAAAAAIFYLASPVVQSWGTVHRVDPLATLLAVAAYAVLCGPPSRWRVVAAALCVVVGSLVKQNVALTAVPLIAYLLFDRRPRAALGLGTLVALLGATIWLSWDHLTGGFIYRTAVQANLGQILLRQAFWASHDFLVTPLGIAAAAVLSYRLVERPGAVSRTVWGVGFLLATALAASLSIKEGASPNYFLEPSALAAMLIGVEGLGAAWAIHRGRTMAVTLVLLAAVLAPEVRFMRSHGLRLPTTPYCGRLIAQRLGPSDGRYALADGQHICAVMQAGWPLLLNDPFLHRLLIDHGHMSARPTVAAIEQGQVAWLVLKRSIEEHQQQVGRVNQKWSPEVLAAMRRWFVLEMADEDRFLFIYRWAGPRPGG
jgi:hypothetical protein